MMRDSVAMRSGLGVGRAVGRGMCVGRHAGSIVGQGGQVSGPWRMCIGVGVVVHV